MRRPPQWTEFQKYPIVAGVCVLAIVASLSWWGKANLAPLVMMPQVGRGELWRLVTCTFQHANFLHLLFNIAWWWTLGTLIEEVFGPVKTLLLFLILAVGSSAAEYAFLSGGVGLSGVVYGAAAMVWVLGRRDLRFAGAIDKNNGMILVIWFFVCIFTTFAHVMDIANIAHGVGALLGAMIAFAITTPRMRTLTSIATTLLVILFVAGATVARPYINFSHDARDEVHLGYVALTAGKNEEASRWLHQAVRFDPGRATAWYNLGVACERLGKFPEAADAFERAHQLETGNDQYAKAAAISREAMGLAR